MADVCFEHGNRPAVGRCYQCHKAVCAQCCKHQEAGIFCSPECFLKYKRFKQEYGQLRGSGVARGALKRIVSLVVLAAIVGAIYYFGFGAGRGMFHQGVQKVKQEAGKVSGQK